MRARGRARSVLVDHANLSEDAADALLAGVPLRLVLSEEKAASLGAALNKAGVEGQWRPSSSVYGACPWHSIAVADVSCEACGRRVCAACVTDASTCCPPCRRRQRRAKRFWALRVAVLSGILIYAWGSHHWATSHRRDWQRPIAVRVHAVAADPDAVAARDALDDGALQPVLAFLDREGARYGVSAGRRMALRVGTAIDRPPPALDEVQTVWAALGYSLALRWWDFRAERSAGLEDADLRVYVVFHSPEDGKSLGHSVGLAKGGVGVAHVFAGAAHRGHANVVIAHELLHLFGASDLYDAAGAPRYPEGYADPAAGPGAPQRWAELMAGSLAVGDGQFRLARDLDECRVGPHTAAEIGWPAAVPPE